MRYDYTSKVMTNIKNTEKISVSETVQLQLSYTVIKI